MKVHHVFVYILACFLPLTLSADEYTIIWADTIDTGDWDGASGVAVDLSSNIVIIGSSFIADNNDYFVVKYDSNGTVLWIDTLDNGEDDYGQAIAVDSSNNIIVTGYSMINSDYDFYTVKYDPNGTIIWQDTLDNLGLYDIARGVAVDNDQNVVVTGYCDIGNDCVYFTVKYDPNGAIVRTDTLDYGLSDSGFDVAVDNAGNVIVTGYTSTGDNNDYLTVKYDSSGTLLWQDIIDTYQYDQAYGVAVDNSANIIVTGCSGGAFDDYDFFTVKYDPNGTVLWSDTLDHDNSDDVAYGIATDHNNNIYVTGYSLPLSGDYDFYTVKYDSNGTILWQDILDNGDNDIAYGIGVDTYNNIIVTGRSYIAETFDHFTVKYAPITGMREYHKQCFNDPVIEISPNPFHDNITIVSKMESIEATAYGSDPFVPYLSVYDATGRLVRQWDYQTIRQSNKIIWDGTDNRGTTLPSGVYLLMMKYGEQRAIKKVLLLR
jgi:uncharacterized delta-60 repeat protein